LNFLTKNCRLIIECQLIVNVNMHNEKKTNKILVLSSK